MNQKVRITKLKWASLKLHESQKWYINIEIVFKLKTIKRVGVDSCSKFVNKISFSYRIFHVHGSDKHKTHFSKLIHIITQEEKRRWQKQMPINHSTKCQ